MARNKVILTNKKLYSTSEVANFLNVSRVTVFNKIRSGVIHAEKVGRNYVIPSNEIGSILGHFVSDKKRKDIDRSVERTVSEYGEALRRLGKE